MMDAPQLTPADFPAQKLAFSLNPWILQITLLLPAFLLYCLSWLETAGLCILLLLICRYVLPQLLNSAQAVGGGGRDLFHNNSGAVFFAATLFVLTLAFHRYLPIVAAAWGLTALGGGMACAAETLGRSRWGGKRLPFNSSKSWLSFCSFVVFGAPGAWFLLLWTTSSEPSGRTLLICLAGALVGAGMQHVPIRLDSRVTVPLASASFIFCAGLISRTSFYENLPFLGIRVVLAVGVNLAFALLALALHQVSRSGAIAGFFLGVAIYMGFGYKSFLILLVFFIFGSGCTRLGYASKRARSIAERRAGARTWREAVANLLPAAFFSFLVITTPYQSAFLAAFVATLAEAAGDTVSSEIGKWLSSKAWLITSFKPVAAGEDGAISLAGTVAGFGASMLILAAAYVLGIVSGWLAVVALAAAFIGNLVDSFLGATLECRGLVTNGIVNFAGTSLAGAIALIAALR